MKPGRLRRKVLIGLMVAAAAALMAFAFVGKHDAQRKRVAEWAGQNGYTIVEVRPRSLVEPCPFLLNDEHGDILRAELEDAGHQRRTAWFRFRLLGMEQA